MVGRVHAGFRATVRQVQTDTSFGDETRPVPLTRYVFGFNKGRNTSEFQFLSSLNHKLLSHIERFSSGKPCVIEDLTQNARVLRNTQELCAICGRYCFRVFYVRS